jgi:hypothetical protein
MLVAVIALKVPIIALDDVHIGLVENHTKKIFINVFGLAERVFYQFDLCPAPLDHEHVGIHEIRRCTDVDDGHKR